jgi:hypothetical protein
MREDLPTPSRGHGPGLNTLCYSDAPCRGSNSSSAWERTSPKLRFAAQHPAVTVFEPWTCAARDSTTERLTRLHSKRSFEDLRAQAEVGTEGKSARDRLSLPRPWVGEPLAHTWLARYPAWRPVGQPSRLHSLRKRFAAAAYEHMRLNRYVATSRTSKSRRTVSIRLL